MSPVSGQELGGGGGGGGEAEGKKKKPASAGNRHIDSRKCHLQFLFLFFVFVKGERSVLFECVCSRRRE